MKERKYRKMGARKHGWWYHPPEILLVGCAPQTPRTDLRPVLGDKNELQSVASEFVERDAVCVRERILI